MNAKPNHDPERLIAAIRRAHEAFPDLRVAQIIANAMDHAGMATTRTFYMENDKLAEFIEQWIKDIK